MKPWALIGWEDRLTRLSFALLGLAVAYGVIVGAWITMYYDVVPNMGSLEDRLGSFPAIAYLVATVAGMFHVPFLVADITHKRSRQAFLRGALAAGPLVVFLGAEGLISHYLWWAPISDTDRFHMLHHSLVAGVPLTAAYGLLISKWWRPANLAGPSTPTRRAWMVSGIVLYFGAILVGILMGMVSLSAVVVFALLGIIGLAVLWRGPG